MQTQFVLASLSRVLTAFNLGYLGLSAYALLAGTYTSPVLLYSCTAGTTLLNGTFTFYLKRMRSTAVNRVEWDVEAECFAVIRPSGLMGETTTLVKQLKMDARKGDTECIYFESSTSG
jgi:hypothetical protein